MDDGTLTPGAAQPPPSQNQINNMYAIARALMNNQPQFMQSRLQPLGQIANAALAGKYLNSAQAADKMLTGGLSSPASGPPGSSAPSATSAATPVSQPGMMPGGQVNPFLYLLQNGGLTGGWGGGGGGGQ